MAKVIFFVSPIDKSKAKEINASGKSIAEILKDLGISDESLAVVINGENPEDCDINYIIKENDLIEIHRVLEGGQSSSEKSGLADVISIAALVASAFTPVGWIKAAVLIGGSLISGALRQKAAEMASKKQAPVDASEVDTSSNSYSLSTLSNEPRPLSPMPMIMGRHNYAPDIYADVVKAVEDNDFAESDIWKHDASFYPGGSSDNGAHSGNWFTMPADFIEPGLPKYEIKIMTYGYKNGTGPLNADENLTFIVNFKEKVISSMSAPSKIGLIPTVIYHSDPDDPYYKKYNLWHFLMRAFESSSLDYDDMQVLYSGDYSSVQYYFYDSAGRYYIHNLLLNDPISEGCYPSTVGYEEIDVGTPPPVTFKIRTFMSTLNGGNLTSEKVLSYEIELQYFRREITSVTSEGFEYSTQVFSFGIGSILEYDFARVGPLIANDGLRIQARIAYSDTFVGNRLQPIRESDKSSGFNFEDEISFPENVLRIDSKKLINYNSPDSIIGPEPSPIIFIGKENNYIEFQGKWGLNVLSFYVSGNLYSSSSSGIGSNTCTIEGYWRVESKDGSEDTDWSGFPNPAGVIYSDIYIQNNNFKKINQRFFVAPDGDEESFKDKRILVKIRKITLDSTNNESGNNCDLYLDKINFFQERYASGNFFRPRTCEQIRGLYIKSTVSDSVQTNKLSCLIGSFCWVYNFSSETWEWQHTRNPAFWFLYFAHGGFIGTINESLPSGYPYQNIEFWTSLRANFYNYPLPDSSTDIIHIFGAGLRDEEIDLDKILEWAEFCEDSELYLDIVFREDTSCADILERIANVGRGSSTYINGKLSVIYEDPDQVPTCMFGMGNIIAGSFSVDYNLADPVRKIVASYVDKETWETETVESLVPFSDTNNPKTVEITLEGVVETQQAQREANILAARQFYQRRIYTWQVDFEGLLARRGDLVYLSHDSTQYGFSGRIISFNMESGSITSIKVGAILDSAIHYVTIRSPDGEMNIYECHVDGELIVFDEPYPLNLAPVFISNTVDNSSSDFSNSIPEDFIFIAGAKETPGKLVRISDIKVNDEDMNFTITALDEDPAMWAYEYDNIISPESFDDVELVLSITNIRIEYPSQGLVKIFWESVNGDFIEIINEATGLPIESSGSYSFSGGEVTIELISNQKYILEIRPFAVGTPFKSVSQKVVVWPK